MSPGAPEKLGPKSKQAEGEPFSSALPGAILSGRMWSSKVHEWVCVSAPCSHSLRISGAFVAQSGNRHRAAEIETSLIGGGAVDLSRASENRISAKGEF